MPDSFVLVTLIVLVALAFDFINGFHDAANSIATVVSTRVLSPRLAVLWAAFFNFVAFLFFGVAVAKTVGKGVVQPEAVDPVVILAGLIGAIAWNLITWYYGLPSSSSHALIGGLVGAAVAKAGVGVVIFSGVRKIALFIVLSPLIGFFLGLSVLACTSWLVRRAPPGHVDRWSRRLQLVTSALYSLGHGANDAQKTMGIIAVLLFSAGWLGPQFFVPFWVVLSAHAAIALGTMAGGWRIVKTMGMRITKLRPVDGLSAETGAAAVLIGTALMGIPVSTTHAIAGGIMGVGAAQRLSAVRWGVARTIVWTWVLTIPCSALVAAASWRLAHLLLA